MLNFVKDSQKGEAKSVFAGMEEAWTTAAAQNKTKKNTLHEQALGVRHIISISLINHEVFISDDCRFEIKLHKIFR